MSIAADSLCMGCMDPKRAGLCPNPETCGWTEGTESQAFPQLPPRTLLDNRYVLGRVLGQGGFGITYLAADLLNYRKLALKEYFPSSFATRTTDRRTVTFAGPANREPYQYGLRKFEEEGRTLQKFQNHPNIVSVMRSFNANGTGYIVMEFLDGVTLLKHLKQQPGSRIPFEKALSILVPIMDALREVHRADVIHRDISPDNIYLCRPGRIKLLDFGAARSALRDQTQSLQLVLKPGYAPEEQYRSSGVAGPYTDIYSLAATFYRSITGVVPPEAPERLSEDRLQAPGKFVKLPAGAEKALMKALAVRAQDRYATIAAFQRDVSPGQPSSPPLKTAGDALARFIRWWVPGVVLMSTGSVLRTDGAAWLSWIGLVPAAVALGVIAPLRRAGNVNTGRWIVFYLLACLGIVATALHPLGAALLIAAIFVARGLGAKPATGKVPAVRARFALRCLSGESAGSTIELGDAPIIIGRLPRLANIVIPLPEISGAHARLSSDAAGNLSIEDLNSRNGTYVQKSAAGSGWVRVTGRVNLTKGDRFCLCDANSATFEVESPAEL